MRKATCDPQARTITAQGGCLWEDVDEASTAHGLATVGGTVHHTGVGGLTLGGGFGWLSYKYGLVVDNLLSATVVVASGEIITATPTENADLFWALCGAGQNFGVAVEFVYQAYPQTDVWGGMLIYTPDQLPQLVEAWNALEPSMLERGLSGGLAFARPPPAEGKAVLMSVVFCNSDDAAQAKQAFAPLYDVGPVMDTTAVMPYKTMNRILSPPISGYRCSMKGVSYTFPLRAEFVAQQFDAFAAFTDPDHEGGIPGSELSMQMFEALPPATMCKRDNTATAFANRGSHYNAVVMPMWRDAEDDAVCRQWARDRSAEYEAELTRSMGGRKKRGLNEAVMFYGNYDRKFFPLSPLFSRRSLFAALALTSDIALISLRTSSDLSQADPTVQNPIVATSALN